MASNTKALTPNVAEGELFSREGKTLAANNSGGESMGANSTQAVATLFFLLAFVLLAGAFAGGGILAALGAMVLLGVSCYLFRKCRPWEHGQTS